MRRRIDSRRAAISANVSVPFLSPKDSQASPRARARSARRSRSRRWPCAARETEEERRARRDRPETVRRGLPEVDLVRRLGAVQEVAEPAEVGVGDEAPPQATGPPLRMSWPNVNGRHPRGALRSRPDSQSAARGNRCHGLAYSAIDVPGPVFSDSGAVLVSESQGAAPRRTQGTVPCHLGHVTEAQSPPTRPCTGLTAARGCRKFSVQPCRGRDRDSISVSRT